MYYRGIDMRDFNIRPNIVAKRLIDFISESTFSRGFDRVILGLSGGLDSTVVAYLSQKALGNKGLIGVIMPYGRLSARALTDARKIASILKIQIKSVDISAMVDAYFKKIPSTDNIRRGNKMARERMSVLYDLSQKYNALVIGTSNKTERLLGYGTVYGDCACAINPIGSLYKTQLRVLAKYLGVPDYILAKTPSADLWHGQSDEQEIGYAYRDIDRLLYFMVDKRLKQEKLLRQGFDVKFIKDIKTKIVKNKFKSQLPLIARL
jgi:NAD+ synthase